MTTTFDLQARLVRELGLMPHPEGGFYRETWRDTLRVTRPDGVERSASTGIYYMLSGNAYSAWHRIRADEAWHFYAGTPIHVHVLGDDGVMTTHRLGNPLLHSGTSFQAIVPAGRWFAAERAREGEDEGEDEGEGFALVGCTVAPGFEFSEFELADAARIAALEQAYPAHAGDIARLASRA